MFYFVLCAFCPPGVRDFNLLLELESEQPLPIRTTHGGENVTRGSGLGHGAGGGWVCSLDGLQEK